MFARRTGPATMRPVPLGTTPPWNALCSVGQPQVMSLPGSGLRVPGLQEGEQCALAGLANAELAHRRIPADRDPRAVASGVQHDDVPRLGVRSPSAVGASRL